MDPLADSRWRQAFPWLTETGRSRQLRRLLQTSESAYRSSAVQMRANGQFEQARKADRRAEWARFQLDDPLIDAAGTLLGVLSTHYPEPRQLQDADRLIIRHYCELAGAIMAQRSSHPGGLV